MANGHIQTCEVPTISYTWTKDEYDRLPLFVQDVRALLQRWFNAMADGTVQAWRPDPLYQPRIEEAVVQRVIEHIDTQFEFELRTWASLEAAGGHDAAPEFGARLTKPQQLALCQQIHMLKVKEQQRPTPVPVWEQPRQSYDPGFDIS